MIRFLFKHNCVCVCVPVHGLMTAMSAESGTQEGISRHCISKAKPLETQDRVFLMRGGTGVCAGVCGSVWCLVWPQYMHTLTHTIKSGQLYMYILHFVTGRKGGRKHTHIP